MLFRSTISRLKATTKVIKPTIVAVMMSGFLVVLSVIFGMAQSAYRPIHQYSLGIFCRCAWQGGNYSKQIRGTHRAEGQRQIEYANICQQHDILSQSGRDPGLGHRDPGKLLQSVSSTETAEKVVAVLTICERSLTV